MYIALLLLISVFLQISQTGPILNNIPITFQMNGATSYNPDSGGQTRNGYKLTLGFYGYSWLAV